jgi:hypothetical protein
LVKTHELEVDMQPLMLVVLLAAMPSQNPAAIKPAVPIDSAQRQERNPTAFRALTVLDSLIPAPPPRSLTPAQAQTWAKQTTWLKSLRDRIRTLLSLVVAPAKVPTPAPIDEKNLLALQKEAEEESLQFSLTSPLLQARHDTAINAIRSIKSE